MVAFGRLFERVLTAAKAGHAGLLGGLIAGREASLRRSFQESDSANAVQLASAGSVV
jgi:hypothetical protein